MEIDEPRFDIDAAAAIAGITPQRIRVLVRAGAPIVDPSQPPRRRYNETDIRTLAVVDAIALEFDLPPADAVAFWADLTPYGTWPRGSKHILFELDGEPVARIYPGAIAAGCARRILARDIANHDEARRLAEARPSFAGSDYLETCAVTRIPAPVKLSQTPRFPGSMGLRSYFEAANQGIRIMSSIRQILMRREAIRTEMRSIVEAHPTDLPAEQATRFAALQTEAEALNASEARAAVLAELDRRAAGVPLGAAADAGFNNLLEGYSIRRGVAASGKLDDGTAGREREGAC